MDLGRLSDINGVDFRLPDDHKATALLLPGKRNPAPEIFTGCPIWAHKEWVGKIYPAKAKEKDFLTYYAQQYNSIELNATHYKTPSPGTIARWVADVPETFRFCPKVPQVISHAKNLYALKMVFDEFIDAILHFEQHLGCTFLQLPPYFRPGHLNELIQLLNTLPDGFQLAVELRNEEWFQDEAALDAIAGYLNSRRFGLVITDVSGRRDVLHQRLTNTTAFIRFTANDLHPSDYTRLDDWATRITDWINAGLERIYFFVHTPEKSLCPELACYFIQELNKKAGTNIRAPKPLIDKSQADLFG